MYLIEGTQAEKSAYEDGFAAGVRGDCPNSTCPHPHHGLLSSVWAKGWFAGDRSRDAGEIAAVIAELGHRRPTTLFEAASRSEMTPTPKST